MTRYLPLHLKPHFQKNMRSFCFTKVMHPSAPFALLCLQRCFTIRLPMPCRCRVDPSSDGLTVCLSGFLGLVCRHMHA